MASGVRRGRTFDKAMGVLAWTAGLLVTAGLVVAAVGLVPTEVNTVGYLVGAEKQVPFHTVSHVRECGRSCTYNTEGYLGGSSTKITVSADFPLGTSVPVREPLWWDHKNGDSVIVNVGDAIFGVLLFLMINFFAVGVLAVTVSNARAKLTHRRGR